MIFFFQAEDGIRDHRVTGVQTCALPIFVAKIDEELEREVFAFAEEDMKFAIRTEEKVERQDKMSAVEEKTLEHFSEIYPERENEIHEIIEKIIVKEVRRLILHESIRPDGRQLR